MYYHSASAMLGSEGLTTALTKKAITFLAITMEGLSIGVLLAISSSSLFSLRGIASF